ncbi:LppX_LprAFG lipoprotein [Nocardioides sp.]|uniref:LppX_LprAFG lipoprotein n=1 Tax=Nocardioides sp. TaxID=35761 RepID=UPI003514D6D0
MRRLLSVPAATLLLLGGLTACGGGDDAAGGGEASPEELLSGAVTRLEETSGVRLTLSTDDTPDADAYLTRAEGVVTDAPAFEGTVSGKFMGIPADGVSVVALGGTLYVDVFGTSQEFDPADLCAPDPALLLDADAGVPEVLAAATDLTAGESRRSEEDTSVIVTPYTATVPGDAVRNLLPCAPGDSFDATFTFTDDDVLEGAEITGEFFDGSGPITYRIGITEYDVEQEISAP